MVRERAWIPGGAGVVALAAMAAVGCAPDSPPADPAPDSMPSAAERTQAPPTPDTPVVPPIFAGDDLEKLLLDAGHVGALFPSVTGVGEASDFDASVGETEGQIGDPASCMPLLWPSDWSLTVGSRSAQWQGADDAVRYGGQHAVQAPSIEQAEESFDWYSDAADDCETFTPRADLTDITYRWTFGAEAERGDTVEVIVGTLGRGGEPSEEVVQIQARAGNALVSISTGLGEAFEADPRRIADSVADALDAAVGELTLASGSGSETAPAGGDDSMSEWVADAGGIGPIRIGSSVAEVRAAVDWIEAPVEGENLSRTPSQALWSQEFDGGTLVITLADDRVSGVEVRADIDVNAPDPDGSGLPSAGGVRIGDSALAASEAFPGGTVFYKMAPGIEQYVVSDIAGQTVSFSAPGLVDPADQFSGYTLENGVITAIAVEDATERESMYEIYTEDLDDPGDSDDHDD